MSLAEIKTAVKQLSPGELAELTAFINEQDGRSWDSEIEKDFSPGGRHHAALDRIDAAIESGDFRPLP